MEIERQDVRVVLASTQPIVLAVTAAVTAEGSSAQHNFRLANISRHGMFLEAVGDELLTDGSAIRFAMQVQSASEGRTQVSGLARVKWTRPKAEGPFKPRGLGIQVVAFDEHAEGRFHQFFESCLGGLRVGDVMQAALARVEASALVKDALRHLQGAALSCVVVTDRAGVPLGTLALDEVAKNLEKPDFLEQPVARGMNRTIEVLTADQPLAVAFMHLSTGRADPLLVTENGALVGLISSRVVLRYWLESMALESHRRERHYERAMEVIAHDLRTPIGVIQSTIQLLTSAQLTADEFGAGDHPSVIEASCNMMLGLIDDILDLSKIKAGAVRIERRAVDMNVLVAAVARAFAANASAKGLKLEVVLAPQLPEVEADPLRLEQIFHNLVSNALKFTPSGGKVCIAVGRKPGAVVVAVSDTGPGIASEEVGRLFCAYACTSNRPLHGEKSVGLGLAIVKKLVEAHGGMITVEATPGKGSTFAVALPLVEKPA